MNRRTEFGLIYDGKTGSAQEYWHEALSTGRWDAIFPMGASGSPHRSIEEPLALKISGASFENLAKLTAESPLLLYVTLLTAVKVCLYKYSRNNVIAVGGPPRSVEDESLEVPQAVVIVDRLDGGMSFRTLLLSVKETVINAYQGRPFRNFVRGLGEDEERRFRPQVWLAVKDFHGDSLPVTSNIELRFERGAAEVHGIANFDRLLFGPDIVQRFIGDFLDVLSRALQDTTISIDDLSALTSVERQQLTVEWNNTSRHFPDNCSISDLFASQVDNAPEAVAIICGDQHLSYLELNQRSNQLANYLKVEKVKPEDRIALCLERGAELIVSILAALKAGGVYVPLDPGYPHERLAYMMKDAQATILLTQEHLLKPLSLTNGRIICLDAEEESIRRESESETESWNAGENLAYVTYTSGSTGEPKGVAVHQRALVARALALVDAYEMNSADRLLQFVSPSFDAFGEEIFTTLICGASLVIEPRAVNYTAHSLFDLVDKLAITILHTSVPYWSQLADELSSSQRRVSNQLRLFITGGESPSVEKLRQWANLTMHPWKYANAYGPTETTITSALHLTEMESNHIRLQVSVPIGRPIANTEFYILDPDLEAAPMGVKGEIYIGGAGVARGYLGRPMISAEKFLPHPFSEKAGARLYRTGDIGRYLVDRNIEFIGRLDEQVKRRGYRIELGEIEAVLGAHRLVKQGIVVASGDETSGKRILAYVVGEKEATAETLRSYVRERLPEYMVPDAIFILEELPLTASGKIDRKKLAAMKSTGRRLEHVSAQTPIEEILVGVFEEVLKLDRVGRDENFFEIGGHSLLAAQVASRIGDVFGVEIGVRSIFEEATVEGLAARIEETIKAGEGEKPPPLVKASRERKLPLSFAQQRLWFIDQLAPGNAVYNCPGAMKLEGQLKLEVLEEVINEIVRRHEILRTRIDIEDGEAVQVIEEWEYQGLDVEDLTSLTLEEKEKEGLRIAKQEARTGFDLRRGPLLRVKVLKLDQEQHVLLFTLHHIAGDAWSMRVLVREVCALYESLCEGQRSPLPELTIQYADYAKWQREYLTGEVLERQVRYWKEQLKGAAIMDLPSDYPRPTAPTFRGSREPVEIGKALSQELKRLSQQEGATMFMALMAAFKALLMRYCGEEDLSVGTAIANRTRSETEGLIGFFGNTLVMRTNLGGNPSFRELIRREREVALGAYAHQEIPFEKLVEEINPERDLSRSPLFQVMMTAQNKGPEKLEIRGLKIDGMGEETGAAKFDLTLALTEGEDGITGILEYSQDLYDRETVRRMARHYERIVEQVAEDAEQKIQEIELMSDDEKRRIVESGGRAQVDYERNTSVNQLFERRVEMSPEAVAVVCEEEQISYRELNRRANQLGQRLKGMEVGPGRMVGICLERSIETVIAMLGVWKAGGVYLPLDPGYPEQRLRFMIKDAEITVIVTRGGVGDKLQADQVRTLNLDEPWEEIARRQDENTMSGAGGDDLAYVIYTSGSTGEPKGVMVTHKNLTGLLAVSRQRFQFTAEEEMLCLASFSFDISLFELLNPMVAGGKVNLLSREWILNNDLLLGELKKTSVVHAVPTLMRQVIEGIKREDAGNVDYGNIEKVFVGGELVTPDLLREISGIFKKSRIEVLYGPTEGTIICTSHTVGSSEAGWKNIIGEPLGNAGIRICDENGRLEPIGVRGELRIGGAGVARGYLHRPELTAERFVPDAYGMEPGARVYRTGDLGRYEADGKIEFLGRRDDQVKLRGYRIELGEIEAALNEHRAVKQSVVIVTEDGSGDKRLVGYVVSGEETTPAELKRYAREKLPEYMVPEAILVIGEIPVTANGKIDRKRLPAAVSLNDVGRQSEEEYAGARTPVEEIVVRIFEEVLKMDRVGIHDNFFEIGGHSLLATRVASRVKTVFGVEIGVKTIFEAPTVNGLAPRISEALSAGERNSPPPLVRVSRGGQSGGKLPLSFAQQRLWFLDQLLPNNPLYNCPGAVKLEGRLNLQALESVINEIIRRHEVLRTRFEVEGGAPMQVIDRWEPRRLEVTDLTCLSSEEREKEIGRLTAEEAGAPFDLSRGPLLRVRVLKLQEAEHILLFTMHHIVSDGWSMGILIKEVGILYQAYNLGEEPRLEELPIQYADFAVWQREWLKGETLEEKLEYWRKRLAGIEALALPTDHPRPPAQSYRGGKYRFVVKREAAAKLRELGEREGATLFMTLLGGFSILLSRWSGQEDIALGTDIANRGRAEIEKLIGFFVNQLVLRVEVRARESFRELLRQVREVCVGAFAHQDVPFEKLVEELQPERDLNRSPLFQAKLVLQNAPREELTLEGVRLLSSGGGELQTAKLDLTVTITDLGGDLVGMAEYSRDLFEGETIERLMSHYLNVLMAIVEDCEKPISELSLLSRTERRQIVVEWNETDRQYPRDLCVDELFAGNVERAPEHIALISEGQAVSYGELDRRANQLAHYLQRLGVGPDVVVGICMERSINLVTGLMGALKAGGAYLSLDPESSLERLSYFLEDAGVGVVLTERKLEGKLPVFWGQIVCLDEEWERIGEESESEPETDVQPQNLAYVIYTSGSTGFPKGVAVERHGVVNLAIWQSHVFHITPQSYISQFFSYSFDGAVGETCMALLNGATLVISATDDLEPKRLIEFLNRQQIHVAVFVPSVLRQVDPAWIENPEWLTVVSVGESCPVELASEWSKRCRFINAYGPTEYTVYSHLSEISDRKALDLGYAPIGYPIDNTKSYILDEALEPTPVGVAGEIYLTGAGVARGYLNQPQVTAVKFIPNHLSFYETPIDQGYISLISANEEIDRFKNGKNLTAWNDHEKKYAATEVISPQRILESVKSLDADLIERTALFIENHCGDEFAYNGFNRYFQEGAQDSYASCGINQDVLKALLPYRSFAGLKGIDFCFGNAEVLQALSEMGAQMLGLDLSPFLVQRARDKNLNVRMAKVDISPETFSEECDVEKESQDFVISTLTLDRLDSPRNFLVNLFNSLKEGGRFAIQTILPIVPTDDGDVERPITYTSMWNRITPGRNVEQDKQTLLTLLYMLGASDVTVCRAPYVVASRDGVQEYDAWSFCGSKSSDRNLNYRNIYYQRLYKTGDLGSYLPDGSIHFLGRIDHQVKIRGFRIELGEIEAVLDEHPSVKQCVVVASDDERGGKRLVGYVVSEEEAPAAELKRYVRGRLPEYMVPEVIIALAEAPVTKSGKIDRKRLPAVKDVDRRLEHEYVVPQTPVEELLAGIFEEVLKLDRVGIDDNFFEIGGHSLLATQVVSRVRVAFGVEIGVGNIFETTTARGLAGRIEAAMRAGEREDAPPPVRASKGRRLPLSFAQQRLWFIDQLEPGNAVYNIPGAVRVEGHLDLEILERVINEIVRRHEILRTRIEVEDGVPVQVIEEWRPRSLEVEDLTELPLEEREEEARRIAKEEAAWVFDMSRGALLRVKALKLEEDEHVVLYTMHHIVSDGWSMGILIREVGALYQAYSMGEPSPLEELPIQYADFAIWQRESLTPVVLERQLGYWREQLADVEPLNLPMDRPQPAMSSRRGGLFTLTLSSEMTAKLVELSRREGVTLFMLLLAAFKIMLHRYTGRDDITVGTDIANRNRRETENLIGFFVNQLALRTNLNGNPTFRELLGRVREVALAAYAHQDLPFEKIVEVLRPDRSLNQAPLFQVKVVMDNTPMERLNLPEMKFEPFGITTDGAKYSLTLTMVNAHEGLRCVFNYDLDWFGDGVGEMAHYFEALLNQVVTSVDVTVNELKAKLDEVDKEQWRLKEKELHEVELLMFRRSRRKVTSQPV